MFLFEDKMPKKTNESETSDSVNSADSTPPPSSRQFLRVATIVEINKIDNTLAAAVMTAYNIRSSDRIEPGKFIQFVEEFKKRKMQKERINR